MGSHGRFETVAFYDWCGSVRRFKRSPARETSGERLLLFLGGSLVDAFRLIRVRFVRHLGLRIRNSRGNTCKSNFFC